MLRTDMIKRFAVLIILAVAVPVVFSGCGYEEPEQGPIKRAPQPPPPPAVEAEAAKEEKTVVAPLGDKQRNPFQSHIIVMRGADSATKVRGPLECCELDVFGIQAVVVSPENSYALVLAPDGKRYIVRKGDVMGLREGRVITIDNTGLTVREYMRDSRGEVISRNDVRIGLPKKGAPVKR